MRLAAAPGPGARFRRGGATVKFTIAPNAAPALALQLGMSGNLEKDARRRHALERRLTFAAALVLTVGLLQAVPALAQDGVDATAEPAATAQSPKVAADRFCFHGRPAPACRFLAVTGFGVSFGSRDAIGVSWFVTIDEIGRTGPALRYRRWLNSGRSLDVAVGLPVAVSESYADTRIGRGGSVLGLITYNPVPWFGFAIRPEVVRIRTGYDCSTADPSSCVAITESTARVLLGIELNERPGAITSAVVWGAMGLLSVLYGGGS
jgi:hypothetical protein